MAKTASKPNPARKGRAKPRPAPRSKAHVEGGANAPPPLVLSVAKDIPFDKLRLSSRNVRRVNAGVSIEDLAEDIAQRTLLQSLSVRPLLDADGADTGLYEVQAGGRRFRALQRLIEQGRIAASAPVPCVVRTEGIAEEDSLAENAHREALHPLDQFRAFETLRERGLSDEDIAARFFVSVKVVRQRLKLASASPKLLDLYAKDEIDLEQLMAFCVTGDHGRQEEVWARLQNSWNKEAHAIRRLLTESAVRASDKRARYVSLDAYEAAGGIVSRDLFSEQGDGWLEDAGLLDRLAREKLDRDAEAIRAEGWLWIEAAVEFPYGHTHGFARVTGKTPKASKKDETARKALEAEFDALQDSIDNEDGDPSEEPDRRLAEIEAALDAFDEARTVYALEDIARAGVFVSLNEAGGLRIERGYVRAEDEPANGASRGFAEDDRGADDSHGHIGLEPAGLGDGASDGEAADAEEDGLKPLSERLMTELTQHRTLALREAVANNANAAYLAVLHTLCLSIFYRRAGHSCLEIEAKSAAFGQPAPGLADSASAQAIAERHARWTERLPEDAADLWAALISLGEKSRASLLAHCAGLTVNASYEPWHGRRSGLAHADQLAGMTGLDMAAAGWKPTVESYLGRVPKARILEAVREARGDQAAQLIDHLKKADMAREAERLLGGTGWVPEPLRTPGAEDRAAEPDIEPEPGAGGADLPDFLASDD